jgi:hypothetical protein
MPGRGRGIKRKAGREEPERVTMLAEDRNPDSTDIWVVGDSLVHWSGTKFS